MRAGISYPSNKREVYEQSDPLVKAAGVVDTRHRLIGWPQAQPVHGGPIDLSEAQNRRARNEAHGRRPVLTLTYGTATSGHRPEWFDGLNPGQQRQAIIDLVDAVLTEVGSDYPLAVQSGNEFFAGFHNDLDWRLWVRFAQAVQGVCEDHGVPFCTGGFTQWPALFYALDKKWVEGFWHKAEWVTELRDEDHEMVDVFSRIVRQLKGAEYLDIHTYSRGNTDVERMTAVVRAFRDLGAHGAMISTEMGAPVRMPGYVYSEESHRLLLLTALIALKEAGFEVAMNFHELQGSQSSRNLEMLGIVRRTETDPQVVEPIPMVYEMVRQWNTGDRS